LRLLNILPGYNSEHHSYVRLPSVFTPSKSSEPSNIPPEELANILQITLQICASIGTSSLLLLAWRRTTKSINTIPRGVNEHVAQTRCVKSAST
jgi:hypothetical protein